MRLLTGTRIGQSGQELRLAILFSFILHGVFLFGGILFAMITTPKIDVPPFYDVALVSETADLPEMPQQMQPEPVPEQPKKTEKQKAKAEPPAAAKKGEMPGLEKKKKATEEKPAKHEEQAQSRLAGPPVAVTAVNTPEFKFPPYLVIVRDKIERYWNPPPGSKLIKAKITFSVGRWGRVSDARLEASSGNFYFDQAAMRAILTASPFPPLPEGFFREFAVFSVDLMERE